MWVYASVRSGEDFMNLKMHFGAFPEHQPGLSQIFSGKVFQAALPENTAFPQH